MTDQILALLEKKRIAEIKNILAEMNPADIAFMMEDMPEESVPLIFRILPKDLAAEAFVNMDSDYQELLIHSFSDSELKAVMDELYVDDAVDIIEELPANIVKRILMHTSADMRKDINELLNYPKSSAGSIMTTEYIAFRTYMTVREAFSKIRRIGLNKETIYTCYVTDENKRLIGLVTAKDLMLNDRDALIGDIMETNVISVGTLEDREVVARMFDKYDFLALPVVDKGGLLVGIVTVDDAMDIISEEAEEDFARIAAITPMDNTYFKTSILKHARNRIPWLLLLMLSAAITGMVLTYYEKAFEAVPLLVSFIPMLMGTGGNCGSQSSTMVIRGLALDEIKLKDWIRVFLKEFGIAIVVGAILSVVNGVRIFIQYKDPMLAIVIGVSLVATIILSKTIGCLLPMCAKKIKLDPAIMAAPLITTIVDTCSVLVYFRIATLLLNI